MVVETPSSRLRPADGLLFTNFSLDAEHRRTLLSHAEWLAEAREAERVSPLVDLPGFDVWKVHFDIMHTLDLGVYQVIALRIVL